MVATVLPPPPPPPNVPVLPPPPPLDPSLLTPPTTTIYSGGTVPGQQVPNVPTPPPGAPPVSTVVGGVRPAGTPAPTQASVLSRLQAAYKEKTGLDLTPDVQEKLFRGESIGLSRPAAGGAPTVTAGPRGYQTLRGRESAATVDYTRAQTSDVTTKTGIAQSAEKRAERESREKATGYTGGEPITAGDLNIDLAGIYRGTGTGEAVNTELYNRAAEAATPLLTAMGYDLNTEPGKKALDDLLRGKTIVPPRMRTIDAQQTISQITNDTRRVNLADREVTVGEKRQEWEQIAEQAKLTGKLNYKGVTTDTLDRWNLQLQQAGLYGKAGDINEGDETLQAKMQGWEQVYRDRSTFGFDRTDEEGNLILGADGKPLHVYGTNELPWVMQTRDQEWSKMQLTGFDYVDPITSERRHVMGRDEAITDQRQFEERTRTGYDRLVYEIDQRTGQPRKHPRTGALIPATDSQGNLIYEHIEGTQQLSDRLTTRELDLREAGMNKDDAARTAALEWDRMQYEGYHLVRTIDLADLGLTVPTTAQANGPALGAWMNTNADAARRLEQTLGHKPTPEELDQLAKGQKVALTKTTTRTVNTPNGPRTETVYEPIVDYIEGTTDLETARNQMSLTLQANDLDAKEADRIAKEAYDDKVRGGYYTTGPMGQPVWIRGTQSDQEYLLFLTDKFNGDRDAADRQFREEQRVGYDKVVQKADGTSTVVHIKGTQEAEEEQAGRVEQLTRDGWKAQDASARARWENEEKSRTGYFRGQYNQATGQYETVWVPGDEAHESELSRLAREHDVTMQDARIAAAASESRLNRLHDRWMQNRAQQYEREGYARADALAKAQREWQTGENALERTLRTDLTEMELTASKNRLEAEGRMQLLATSIAAMATLGSNVLTRIFDNGSSALIQNIANGSITAANFGTEAVKAGLTTAEASTVATMLAEGATAVEVESISVGAGYTGAAASPAASFGSQLAAVAGPAVAIAAVVYGGYQVGKGLYEEGERKKAFDSWFDTELPPSQRADFRAAISEGRGNWSDDRGNIFDLIKGYQEARASGVDLATVSAPTFAHRRARDLVFTMEEMQAQDTVRIAAGIRNLADRGVFPADGKYSVGNLTRAQKTELLDAWSRMPSDYRKTELPETMWKRPIDKWSVSNEQLEAMRNDLAKYGVDNGVRSSAQLSKDIADTLTRLGPKIAQISSKLPGDVRTQAGSARRVSTDMQADLRQGRGPAAWDEATGILTLDEENTIRALWLQRGGDPRVPLAIQATKLTTPPTSAGGADQVQDESTVWQNWFKEYQPKIGDAS